MLVGSHPKHDLRILSIVSNLYLTRVEIKLPGTSMEIEISVLTILLLL